NHFEPFLLCQLVRRREKELRRPREQQGKCQMTLAEKSSNCRPKSHGFALKRTVSCRFLCGRRESPKLVADGDAQGADVAAGVKRAQGDGVLAGPERTKFHGVNFVSTVGDTIIRKYRSPRSSVETRVGFLDLSGRVINRKNHAHRVSRDLRLAHYLDHRWRVIDIDRFAQSLAG